MATADKLIGKVKETTGNLLRQDDLVKRGRKQRMYGEYETMIRNVRKEMNHMIDQNAQELKEEIKDILRGLFTKDLDQQMETFSSPATKTSEMRSPEQSHKMNSNGNKQQREGFGISPSQPKQRDKVQERNLPREKHGVEHPTERTRTPEAHHMKKHDDPIKEYEVKLPTETSRTSEPHFKTEKQDVPVEKGKIEQVSKEPPQENLVQDVAETVTEVTTVESATKVTQVRIHKRDEQPEDEEKPLSEENVKETRAMNVNDNAINNDAMRESDMEVPMKYKELSTVPDEPQSSPRQRADTMEKTKTPKDIVPVSPSQICKYQEAGPMSKSVQEYKNTQEPLAPPPPGATKISPLNEQENKSDPLDMQFFA